MKVIDRYIGKRFFINFFGVLCAFIIVFSMIHWVDHSGKYAKADITTILSFYINYVPQIINLVIPVCGLLAGLLTFSNLGKYNELVALQVSGVSRSRYLLPALIISFLISIALFFFNELVLIESNIKRQHIEQVQILKRNAKVKGIKTNVLLNSLNNSIIQIGKVNISKGVITDFNIQFKSDSTEQVIKRIDSDSVIWTDSTHWVLKNAYTREIEHDSVISVLKSEKLSIEETGFKPNDFEEPKFRPDRVDRYLTLKELKHFSEKQSLFGQTTYQVDYEIFNTFFSPLSIFFMAFIGSILGSMFTKGNAIFYFLGCIIICLMYMVIVIMGKVMSQNNEISPFLGASLPHITTFLVLTFLMNKKS